ncbi:Bax inhibitor-1/YccA family protein [Candidatus Trichorickettsia mobilis]|uniref:Bax inhibitor-1/YccA family protein n=1 Tax=Candidatus Trichorickettsia mobilis TaxID=1346319 RepID=A0ABZ0UU83_9RICK|nr:Bax inhibitor-1/YccA family protein [Candidatus Trichorickettsia mobilis]WPY00548.1 Bax inhibitor-1/YccA family protein [Candidatus Trichorickettsia mobilis]
MIDYTKTFAGAQKTYDAGLREYMLKIYNYMTIALVITGVMAFAVATSESLTALMFTFSPAGKFTGNTGFGWLIVLAPIAIAFYFFMGMGRLSLSSTKILFWVYSALTGMSLASLALVYTGESIARTLFICASLFGAMSLYGYTTQKDLTSFGSFLMMGLIGLILASLVNIFFNSPAISFVTSLIGVGIFMGLIAWDTQKLKSMYYTSGGGELGQKMAIMGAFTLYLDFINLFLYLIRFFGNVRRD